MRHALLFVGLVACTPPAALRNGAACPTNAETRCTQDVLEVCAGGHWVPASESSCTDQGGVCCLAPTVADFGRAYQCARRADCVAP